MIVEDEDYAYETNRQREVDWADAEERYLREILARLQESYAKAAKPFIDRLVAIHTLRAPAPVLVTAKQAAEWLSFRQDQQLKELEDGN